MNEFLVLLQAKLDEAKSKGLINSDIASLQGQLDKLKLQVELDPNATQKLANDIEKLINQKITISNINIDTNQAVRNAQQSGQQIGRQIQNGINSVIQKGNFTTEFTFSADKRNNVAKVAQEEFQKIANGIVTVKEQMSRVDGKSFLDEFIVNIKKANGEIESLTYRLKDMLDSQGKATGKSFQYIGGSINDNGVLKQFDAISAKADNLQTRLDKLKSSYSDINTSRPIKDSNNISALSQQYDKVFQAIENVRNADNTTFSSMVSNAQREITALESMVTQFRNAENVATQMKSVDISSGIAQAQERLGKLKADSTGFEQMTQTLRELDAAITNVGNKSSLDAFIDKLRVAETQLSRVKAETKSMTQVNKIQLSMGNGTYESKVDALVAKTQQWTDVNGNARISTNELSKAFDQLTTASNNYANSPTEAHQKALIASEKELDKQIKTVTNSVRSMNAELAKDSAISSFRNQVADFMSKNGKTVKSFQFGSELKDIFAKIQQGAKLSNQELAVIKQRFIDVQNAARQTGKLGKTWFQTLREGMSSFSYWTSSTFLVMKAIQSIKGGLGTVKALDTALVDLKKTTTMTNSELEYFYYSSNKVAKQMGVTTEEILKQAAAWSRLGYSSAEQATKMAQLSSQFASISPGMSTDEAQEGLVSIIKAWGLDVDEVEREVMDNINHLGNRFAESNIDLVNGMKRSAAALAATGTTYQDAFALFTGAQEVVQNAEVTGRALRSISMRMHGYSESSEDGLMEVDEELKNITGDLIDLTKTAEHSQGVSIFKEGSSTEFKSLVEYFGEINKIWDEMSQVQQNSFLDKAFGKNQAQAGAAIVQNYEAIAEAIKVMEDAAGSSDREMSIIMDSLDYKLNRLSETGTSVAQNLFKRDDMATVVDGLTSVMSVIDKLTSKLGLFGSIGLGAGIFAGVKNIGKAV